MITLIAVAVAYTVSKLRSLTRMVGLVVIALGAAFAVGFSKGLDL